MAFTREIRISLTVIACIALDCLGRLIASEYALPLWLDTIGTSIAAYAFGPVCGAMTALTFSIGFSDLTGNAVELLYGSTGVAIGIAVGIGARRGIFKSVFRVFSLSFFIAALSTAISAPINLVTKNGMTGNPWSDGLINMLEENGAGHALSGFIGQFYLDFPDKLLSLLAVYAFIRLWSLRKRPV